MDVGCYAVNLSRWLLGDEPREVKASARLDPGTGIDLSFSAILDYMPDLGLAPGMMVGDPAIPPAAPR